MSDRFDELRREIDATDADIVQLVNRRLQLVTELWVLKRERGLDRVDPGREQALREALAQGNAGPLSPAGLERLITEILALTKAEVADRGANGS